MPLRSYDWHSGYMDGSDIGYKVLYPLGKKVLRGLPTKINAEYQAAQKVRNIDANAFGVLLGRVLDLVCEDRNASGETLDQKLKTISENNEIPLKLVAAAGIRNGEHSTGVPCHENPNRPLARGRGVPGPWVTTGSHNQGSLCPLIAT